MAARETQRMIEARVVLTKEIILQGFLLHTKHRQRFLKVLPVIGGLLTLVSLYNMFQVDSVITILPALLPGLFLLGLPLILRQLAKRNVAKLPTLGREMVWQLNKQGLTGQTSSGNFSQTWQSMEDALISDDGILIYSQKIVTHWLPRSAFSSTADFQQAKQFVQNGVQHHQKV
jgi:hypothetical protein